MKSILFVDDDQSILEDLKLRLTGRMIDWEFVFVNSADLAIKTMEDRHFDVIVADAHIGGVPGDQLLRSARDIHPELIMIAVDAGTHPQKVFERASVAHQYLSRPCDPEQLVQTIKRISELHEELSGAPLARIVNRIKRLPSTPTLYAEIMTELKSPASSLERVGVIVSKDVAMTAKVLQLANSAFFGFAQAITDPGHACSILGINTITSLALTTGIFKESNLGRTAPLSITQLMEHSTLVGISARAIAIEEKLSPELVDISFLAGFLHDVGKLVLAHNLPKQYREVHALKKEEGLTLIEAEARILGANHAQVGGYLLGLWGLPDPVVEAVLRHHWPITSRDDNFSPLTAVHVSNAFAEASSPRDSDPDVDSQYLRAIGCSSRLSRWREIFYEVLDHESSPAI